MPIEFHRDGPWDLPDGWVWTRLGNLVDLRGEKAPPDKDSSFAFVGMDDVPANSLRIETTGAFKSMKSAGNKFYSRDILYGRLRPYLNKVVVAGFEGVASGEFIVMKARKGVDPRYLQLWMHARRFVNDAMRDTSGDRPRIDFEKIAGIDLPLPPSPEQKRIIERIDALFTETADGEIALTRARADLDTWRRALLKAAVTGELTREWRERLRSQSVTQQVQEGRLLSVRKELGAQIQLTSGRDEFVRPQLPRGWASGVLEQIGRIESGQTPMGIAELTSKTGGVPWFKVSSMNDARADGWMNTSQWYVSDEVVNKLKLRVHPAGTIVFPKRGGSILTNKKRRIAVRGCFDLNTMGFVPLEGYEEFSWVFFQQVDLKRIFDGSNVPQINYGDIAGITVAIPPPREGQEIARRVAFALSDTDDCIADIEAGIAASRALRQSILKTAFEGRLVEQDARDEPAEVMLARLGGSAPPAKARARRVGARA